MGAANSLGVTKQTNKQKNPKTKTKEPSLRYVGLPIDSRAGLFVIASINHGLLLNMYLTYRWREEVKAKTTERRTFW